MAWRKTSIGQFLIPHEERYKANDPAIAEMPRIEKIDFSGNIVISQKPSRTDMIVIHPGDFVISGINVAKGAMAVYQGSEPVKATIHYSSYMVNKDVIELEYLKRFLKSPVFIQLLKEQVPGGIKTEIKPKHLLPLVIDLPQLSEQKAILARFYNTEDEYRQLVGEIETQKVLLAKYRQAILQEAIQGKLTADWREQHPDVEPASELLKRIAAEKAELVKQKKIKKGKITKNSKVVINDVNIPDLWEFCKADEIFFVTKLAGFEYTKHVTLRDSGDVPVIRAQNVRPLVIDKTSLKYIDLDTSVLLGRCALTKQCLLVTFIGAGIGDVSLFNEANRWHLAPNVAKMEFFEGWEHRLSLKYFNYFLFSSIGRRELFKHIKATAQPSLSMNTIRDIDFPIPPFAEQQEIVRRVEAKFALCDKLEAEITAAEQHAEHLSTAILQEVFDG